MFLPGESQGRGSLVGYSPRGRKELDTTERLHLTSEVKASACNAGDLGSIPGSGRYLGEGNGNPLQYSCLENPMDGGAWWATAHRVAKSRTQLSDFTSLETHFRTKDIYRLKVGGGDLPGGPVAKTPRSQCRSPRFHPWSGN